MIGFLIFDLDGTLIDSYDAITDSLNYALGRLGRPGRSPRDVRSRVGHGLESLVRDVAGEDCVAEGVKLFRRHYARVCIEGTRLLPEVPETLARLLRRGMRMAVATNKPAGFTEKILESFGIRRYFEFLYGADQVTHPKPHPEMFWRVLRRAGCSRIETACVGDMEVDIETARRAGLRVAVVATGSRTRRQLEMARPDLILDRFSDLPLRLAALAGRQAERPGAASAAVGPAPASAGPPSSVKEAIG